LTFFVEFSVLWPADSSATSGNLLVFVGDVLVLLGLVATFIVYRFERMASVDRDIDSVLAMLEAVRNGMRPWGDLYFAEGYDEPSAKARAQRDSFDSIMKGSYGQIFLVPTEPLSALVERPGGLGLVRKETTEAANIALWKIGVFNQLVRQQTEFNALHLAEFYDRDLALERRQVLAEAAGTISGMLHLDAIGDADFYRRLNAELDKNIEDLRHLRHRKWWAKIARPSRRSV
jgi:hypothetical protein